MNIRNGAKPIVLDARDRSYHRTCQNYEKRVFGGVIAINRYAATRQLYDFNTDAGITMPDQNADGYPEGCTGYCQSDNKQDEEKVKKDPAFTYGKTCLIEGHDMNQGCDIRNSLKSTQIYGVKTLGETDAQTLNHRGGGYFNIYDDGGYDWFDGVLVAVRNESHGASIGIPWFPSWDQIPPTGILPMPTVLELQQAKSDPFSLPWHNPAVKGAVTENGYPYWLVKPWRGPGIGDKGWHMVSREIANVVMEIRGAGAFIQAPYTAADIVTIKIEILEQAIAFLYRLISLQRLN